MPKQTAKSELSRMPGDQNLWIYAGWLDIANSNESWSTLLNLTKIYALFYERILVYDGYFHCKGPLFSALESAYRAKPDFRNGWTEEELQEHEILKLLFEGIVVPGHRQGDSMAHVFSNELRGIKPGAFLSVDKEPGARVLDMVDSVSRHYYLQPKMSANDFHKALWESLTDRQTDIGRMLANPGSIEKAKSLPREAVKDIQKTIEKFHGALINNYAKEEFRRGWIENWAAKELGLKSLHGYDTFGAKIDYGSPHETAKAAVVLELLNSVSTAYELMHADAFNCQAGLFTTHDRDIPKLPAMRKIRTATESEGPKLPSEIKIDSLEHVGALSARDIVNFREYGPFIEYCERMKKLRQPSEGESIMAANKDFEVFLFGTYAKAISDLLRKSSTKTAWPIELSAAAGRVGAGVLAFATAQYADVIQFKGIDVATILRGAAGAVGTVAALGAVEPIDRFIRRVQLANDLRRFEKNNYGLRAH